ncbi:MAG: hypothetical protein FWC78_04230 [Defluviitaleaceae bacterium]|nr:hypothetical protein [Defluviitaleaceae bacterium]
MATTRGQIYLYGELHCDEEIMQMQLALWRKHYHDEKLRYLFHEHCYCTTAFLNIWMRSASDDVLEMLYETALAPDFPYVKDFYQAIKKDCPETVFCGTTPVYPPIGEKYVQYLEATNKKGSDEYFLVQELLEKGKKLYKKYGGEWDDGYRETNMVKNFIREFEKLNGESVMGIYGYMHISAVYFGEEPSLGYQLKKRYGEAVHFKDLSGMQSQEQLITICN